MVGRRGPLLALGSSFVLMTLASGVGVSGCGEQDYPATAFRCDPGGDSCPGDYLCCSTDPAAIDPGDLESMALPDYAGGPGLPIFSGPNNGLGQYGRCVDPAAIDPVAVFTDVDPATGSIAGCPLPCNPTWDPASVTAVCGADSFCCQTDEIGEADCAFDSSLGAAGCWRPVSGRDIHSLGGLDVSDWGPSDHDTHQDPRALGCKDFIAGQSWVDPNVAKLACYRKLGVANQRGLCTAAKGETEVGLVCPLADPEYRDACERKNDAEALAGC